DIRTYGSLSETDSDLVYFDKEVFILRDADIRMGGGDDLMLVTNPDQDLIIWGGLTTNGSLSIDLGDGDDLAYLRGVKTGGNFSLYTGAGADSVTIDNRAIDKWDGTFFVPRVGGNLVVQTYDSLAETDRDEVRMLDATVLGSLEARLGGGDDFFSL